MKSISDASRLCLLLTGLVVLTLFMTATCALAGPRRLGFFVGDVDAYTCAQALEAVEDAKGIEIRIFTDNVMNTPATTEFLRLMDVAVVDIMPPQPAGWLLENRSVLKPGVRIYAVRSSSHNQDFLNAGFIMDEKVRTYFSYTSADNLVNLIRFLAHRDLGLAANAPPPIVPPENALYHPDAPGLFSDLKDYVQWYRESGHFKEKGLWNLSIIFPTFALDGKKAPLDALIQAYERQGINTVTWFREMKDRDKNLARLLATEPLAGGLGSITGFDFKFSSTLTGGLSTVLEKANVPIFNAQYLFFSSGEDWLKSPQGVSPADIPLQFSTPEISGLVEPTVLGVKERVLAERKDIDAFIYKPVTAHVEILARRAAKWHGLRQKSNADKKIVLVYYNHGAGKQNIGASYLNVFRSIDTIIRNLKQAGYTITGELTEEKVKDLLLKSGRNIGSWAPNELDQLLAEGNAAFVNMTDYRRWLAQTPPEFREAVEKDWGNPEDGKIMMKDGRFVIPCVRLGNLTLAPQPVRGWSDDLDKLYHSTVLQPHHQYTAFYFWLQNEIRPDAMISLGTHGTHEWLPGKQAGLTWKCPPEVLIGDIPSLYPYIVDDVGEGIQAKRRGRAVIIDHAVPPLKAGGVYAEYSQLAALISEFEASSSDKIRDSRLERIRTLVTKLGLDKDLELSAIHESDLEKIEHYLLTLKTEMIPYGMHTFGTSPSGEGLAETAAAMAEKGDQSVQYYQEQLMACGPSEMASLIRGLSGGYIPSAPGNDPIRNPESLPTGKNFYGFDPEKTPSREAWENGKKAAQELIDAYRKKHEGKYPEQVGVILWSVETIRDEGINTATALYLMGMTPVWDHRDKVKDVAPIPGSELNRPRIDVLLQMSGLFRDSFPTVALLLDRAVKKAATLTDLENFLSKHSKALETSLIQEGHAPEAARKLSLVRLFSAASGAYGTKVDDMTGASGLWEKDDVVAEQGFIQMQSHGYSSDMWGEKLTPVYRKHLQNVDATVHTISSNLYGTMDNDDMFQYLGGLSMAVRKESGKDPEVFISMQRTRGKGHIESLAMTLGQELRSRYLNPTWIEGMKKESYAGAREMAEFMENMWGWQVTTPGAVDAAKWEQTYEVYVEDKYGLDIKEFFNRENPWAHQSMTARMLEAVRKNYWHADEKITRKLAAEYALNVVEKGVACCDHTCNNPVLNQMVVSIISIPGVLSPEIVEKFTLAVEQAAGRSLDDQVRDRAQLLEALKEAQVKQDVSLQPDKANPERPQPDKADPDAPQPEKTAEGAGDTPTTVEGYRMEKIDSNDAHTRVSTSGVQWFAAVFILLLIGLFVTGAQTYEKHRA
ncbi:MAG: cobaltochelatase subunit CobN [Pseudomonadota bacterium]